MPAGGHGSQDWGLRRAGVPCRNAGEEEGGQESWQRGPGLAGGHTLGAQGSPVAREEGP